MDVVHAWPDLVRIMDSAKSTQQFHARARALHRYDVTVHGDNRLDDVVAWHPPGKPCFASPWKPTNKVSPANLATGKSFLLYAAGHSLTGQPSPTLPTTSTQLVPLRTSRHQATQRGDPFLPKTCKPLLPRTHAYPHLENQS